MSLLPDESEIDTAQCRRRVRAAPESGPEEAMLLPALEKLNLPREYKVALSVLIKRARADFETYLLLFNLPGQGYIYSKLHEYLVNRVQGVVDGTLKKRQITTVPPQHGKSTVLAMEAASWLLGGRPGIQVAITSFSNDLVTDFSKWIRDRTAHPIYQLVFPNVAPVFGSNRMDSWKLTNGSGIRAKPIGSKLTGRRVDWLIIDDPHAGREEAESPTMRKRVLDWYFADCYTRLSPEAAVFIIGTRWHPQDLVGSLTAEEHVKNLRAAGIEDEVFEINNLPAICEDEESDPIGRKNGEALFPEQRGVKFLRNIEHNIPEYEWASQYQSRPQASGSGQADTGNLVKIDDSEVPKHLECVRSWDMALTEKQKNDFTAGARMSYDPVEDILYIRGMWHGKKVWPKMRVIMLQLTKEDKEQHNILRVGIEAVAGFGAVYQDIKANTLGEVRVLAILPPKGGKLTRALPWLNKIEAGKVRISRGPWVKGFEEELTTFPDGLNDDRIDAVSGGWEMLTGRNRNGVPNAGGERPSGANRPAGLRLNGGTADTASRASQDEGDRLRAIAEAKRRGVALEEQGDEASDFTEEERAIMVEIAAAAR